MLKFYHLYVIQEGPPPTSTTTIVVHKFGITLFPSQSSTFLGFIDWTILYENEIVLPSKMHSTNLKLGFPWGDLCYAAYHVVHYADISRQFTSINFVCYPD